MSKFTGCSLHIQQLAAANLYRKSYIQVLNAAAFWLQPAVMNFDVTPKKVLISKSVYISIDQCHSR